MPETELSKKRLKKVIKEVKYWYDLSTDREFLDKLGYKSTTFLSDIYSGKSTINEKFRNNLKNVFGINPGVFDGERQVFVAESQFQATMDEGIDENGEKTILIGHNFALGKNGSAADHIGKVENKDGVDDKVVCNLTDEIKGLRDEIKDLGEKQKEAIDSIRSLHSDEMQKLREQHAAEMKAQREDAQAQRQDLLKELQAQREMTQTILSVISSKKDN